MCDVESFSSGRYQRNSKIEVKDYVPNLYITFYISKSFYLNPQFNGTNLKSRYE